VERRAAPVLAKRDWFLLQVIVSAGVGLVYLLLLLPLLIAELFQAHGAARVFFI
jgi:hypothetical protein